MYGNFQKEAKDCRRGRRCTSTGPEHRCLHLSLIHILIQAKIKLDVRQDTKSNAGYIFRCSDFDVGQDDQYGYVSGINYNAQVETGEEASGLETGDIHYGWRSIMRCV